jgi:hypothetical protein
MTVFLFLKYYIVFHLAFLGDCVMTVFLFLKYYIAIHLAYFIKVTAL